MGIFLTLALYSFSPTDPSLNSIGRSVDAQNYCGYFGSFLADILYQLFGLSAWILAIGAIRVSIKAFNGQEIKNKGGRWVWTGLLLLTGASLLALYWPSKHIFSGHIPAGGLLGAVISRALINVFNHAGVAVILWTAVLVLVVFYTEKSLKELFAWPISAYYFLRSKLKNVSLAARAIDLFKKFAASISDWLQPQVAMATAEPTTTALKKFFPIHDKDTTTNESAARARGEEAAQKEASGSDEDFVKDVFKNFDAMELEIANENVAAAGNTEAAKPQETPKKRHISLNRKVERKIENWELPKISILEDPPYNRKKVDERELREKAFKLVNKLNHFGAEGEVVGVKPGPAVTMFEFKPNATVKISNITNLADDLALELSSESVRIIAPIPGRDVVGIETSNSIRETVYLKEILASDEYWDDKMVLPLTLGCEADGSQKVVDLRKLPHMLVAGTTGSGKSVFVVSMITGLLFRHSPKTLRLILIDPKQVDLAVFSQVPHLLMPPIREPKKAISALKWAIKEMEKRYRSMAKFGARDIESFNTKVKQLSSGDISEHEKTNAEMEQDPIQAGQMYYYAPQPYIVIVAEEFGDLMSVDKHNVEGGVVRLAQMARACGIHLILAMQSPRKEVVTGLIKTNIPGRVSFKVASKMDSRIILDESGAERLLSRGDMLFLAPGVSKPLRHHGPWIADSEIQAVADFWTKQAEPEFDPAAMRALEGAAASTLNGEYGDDAGGGSDEFDERYDEILAYIGTLKEVSASHIQTRFRLGYPRAARLIEVFEQQGVIGPANGSKKRQVLINELK